MICCGLKILLNVVRVKQTTQVIAIAVWFFTKKYSATKNFYLLMWKAPISFKYLFCFIKDYYYTMEINRVLLRSCNSLRIYLQKYHFKKMKKMIAV